MTVGSWQPDAGPSSVSAELLQPALQIDIDNFPSAAPDTVQALQPFMQANADAWQSALEAQTTEQLQHLSRFFTLAEKHWADWFGGDKNPVIWICKELKKRGAFPNKALTRWIKQHTDNRFLPYGNALG